MFKIKVSATSANLGCGFDVLGLALSIYNEYLFSQSDEFSLKGFLPRYLNQDKNLVLSAYKRAFDYAERKIIQAEITEICANIPRSGGLGSSAACVVSGILGANKMMGNPLSLRDILNLAASIDGHPDNVSAALMGGLTACLKTVEGYRVEKYPVSNKLKFMICYPDLYLSTELMRKGLPKELPLNQVVENMSRIVNLPRAFQLGDIGLLRECVVDNIHEPYRIKLIEGGAGIQSMANALGAAAVISGSGASMLVIADNEEKLEKIKQQNVKRKWKFIKASPCFEVNG